MVDEGFDAGDRAGADGREVGAFAEVTSELAVEVFDGAFLPGAVGVGVVDGGADDAFEGGLVEELAVVAFRLRIRSVAIGGHGADRAEGAFGDEATEGALADGAKLAQENVAGAAFDQDEEPAAAGVKMKTILTDNDIVFIDAPKLHAITGATIYYTDAYAGWQKGNVENCNKIIRRRHDKGTDFSKMSKREERHTQWWINNYPRPTDIKKKATTKV